MKSYSSLIITSFLITFTAQAQSLDKKAVCSSLEPVSAIFEQYGARDVLEKLKDLRRFSESVPLENGEVIIQDMRGMVSDAMRAADAKSLVIEILRGLNETDFSEIKIVVDAYLKALEDGITQIQFDTTDSDDSNRFLIREERIELLKKRLISNYTTAIEMVFNITSVKSEEQSFLKQWIFEVFQASRGIDQTESYVLMSDYLRDLESNWGVLYSTDRSTSGSWSYLRQNIAISMNPGYLYSFIFEEKEQSKDDLSVNILISPFIPLNTPMNELMSICGYKTARKECEYTTVKEWCSQ